MKTCFLFQNYLSMFDSLGCLKSVQSDVFQGILGNAAIFKDLAVNV